MANRIRRSLVMRVGIRVVMRPPNACGDGVRSSSSLVAGGSRGVSWWRRARRRGSRVAEEDVLELASCRPPAGDQKRQRCRRRWGREALLPKRRKSGSGATDARPGAHGPGSSRGSDWGAASSAGGRRCQVARRQHDPGGRWWRRWWKEGCCRRALLHLVMKDLRRRRWILRRN